MKIIRSRRVSGSARDVLEDSDGSYEDLGAEGNRVGKEDLQIDLESVLLMRLRLVIEALERW